MFDVSKDVRIEIMQALLNQAVVSGEAFNEIAALFENVAGKDNDAWAAYKAMFGASSASSAT